MSHTIEAPRIVAIIVDVNTHQVCVVDAAMRVVTSFPAGASVLEVWAAHVLEGVPVERAYASFSWMKPATSLPVNVPIPSVTGSDPQRGGPGRWHLFYKARWVREGQVVSPWSNVVVAGDDQRSAEVKSSAPGGCSPI